MDIQWKTGKPDHNGEFIVIMNTPRHFVMQLPFTVENGWNTSFATSKHAFPDEDVLLWTELFAQKAIDIYVLP